LTLRAATVRGEKSGNIVGQLPKTKTDLPSEQVLYRIAALTLGFGFAGAVLALALHRSDWAIGVVSGALLGWLNFRWLRRGIRAMVITAMAQAEVQAPSTHEETHVNNPKSKVSVVATYVTLIFRYALVAFGVYVIFMYLHVPLVSIGLGLCALIAAIMTASVWEVLKTIR
jgi:hypothetical protein